jgi:hypothetical protein
LVGLICASPAVYLLHEQDTSDEQIGIALEFFGSFLGTVGLESGVVTIRWRSSLLDTCGLRYACAKPTSYSDILLWRHIFCFTHVETSFVVQSSTILYIERFGGTLAENSQHRLDPSTHYRDYPLFIFTCNDRIQLKSAIATVSLKVQDR